VVDNWPTPRAEERCQYNSREGDNYEALSLRVQRWETPTVRDCKNPNHETSGNYQRKKKRGWTIDLNDQAHNWKGPEEDKKFWKTPHGMAGVDQTGKRGGPGGGEFGLQISQWADSNKELYETTVGDSASEGLSVGDGERDEATGQCTSEFERTGGDVADPGDTRLPESESPPPGRKGRRDEGRTIAEFSGAQIYADIEPFPPGPADLDKWRDIIAVRPDLAPAVSQEEAEAQSKLRGLADELDPWMDRVDRLRAGGNGVVPLQAAYGICLLAASLGSRCRGE